VSADTCEAITKNIGELFRIIESRDVAIYSVAVMASALKVLMQVLYVASTHREYYSSVDVFTKAVMVSCLDNVVST
jgi:hypothetical protein